MSGQEGGGGGEEGEEGEESPDVPIMNLFLQDAVYSLMAEFDIQINPNPPPHPPPPPPQEPQRESSRSTAGIKIRIIGPALPLKKRSFESTGGVDDSEENEKKNKKNKKEDQKPRRESAEEYLEENEIKKQEDDQEPRSEPVKDSLENEEKMEEDDQEPRSSKPAEDEKQKKDQKTRSGPGEDPQEDERKKNEDGKEPAEDSLEKEEKMEEDDQGSRIEPAVQDSQNDERLRKKEDVHKLRNDATEGSNKTGFGEEVVQGPINEEDQFAALMLLTFVARYIYFWRQLHHYGETEDPPVLPFYHSNYSPSSLLHDFKYTPALPVNRRLFDFLDESDDYQEPTIAEGLGEHLNSLYFDTRAQITFLKILSQYMNVNNEDPSEYRTIPAEFITDWFPHDVRLSDVYTAFEFLAMQHKEKLRQIEAKSDYWDQYERMAYEYGSQIWGGGDDVDSNVAEPNPMRTSSTGVEIQDDNDSQIAQNVTEVGDLTEAWTHLDTEIAIFDRVIAYKVRNGRNPFHDESDLADFIKNWLQIDVPVKEFNELMTCLRKKYAKRAGKRPSDESSSKTKEDHVLDFAHKIWG